MSKSKELFMKIRETEEFLDADYLYHQWIQSQAPPKKLNTITDDDYYEDFIDLRPEEETDMNDLNDVFEY